jgi:hypothetical protein
MDPLPIHFFTIVLNGQPFITIFRGVPPPALRMALARVGGVFNLPATTRGRPARGRIEEAK